MKSGFRDTLTTILNKHGMGRGVHGTVLAVGDSMWKIVNSMGFPVEQGLGASNYDYVILSEKKSTVENILSALTKVDNGCIVIFRFDGNTGYLENLKYLGVVSYEFYPYGDGKVLGVLLKRGEK